MYLPDLPFTSLLMCACVLSLQSCPTLCNPMDCMQPARLFCSWGFSRQEYWSELPCPPPGGLPDPGIQASSLTSPALLGGFFTTSTTREAQQSLHLLLKTTGLLKWLRAFEFGFRFSNNFWEQLQILLNVIESPL